MFAWRSNCCGYRVVWARLTSTESLETTRAPRVNLSGKQFGPRPRQLGGPLAPRCLGRATIVVATASFGRASRQLGASRQRERRRVNSSGKTFGAPWRQLARAQTT